MKYSELRECELASWAAEKERDRLLALAQREGLSVTTSDFRGQAPDALSVRLSAKDFRLLLERAGQARADWRTAQDTVSAVNDRPQD